MDDPENAKKGVQNPPQILEEDVHDPFVSNGFQMPDLGAATDAPPAYGDAHDHLQLSQAGFETSAAVTDDGRVNININQTNRRFSDVLAPTLRSQILPSSKTPSEPLPPAYIPPSLGGVAGQIPPPRLNVVIQVVGSRGDVQPFVALGKVLKDTYGHRVRLATHATFQKFVEENGLEFFSIGGDPAELMAFMVKNPGLMPGMDALKSGEIRRRREGIEEIVLGCWRSCIEAGNGLGPAPEPHRPDEPLDESHYLPGAPPSKPFVADAIIANPPSFAHIHIAEKLSIPLHMMFTMPWSPTRAFPHPLANIQSSNTDVVMTNYVSYALVEMMTWQGLGDVINRFRTKVLDLDPLSLIWAPGLLTRLHIPTTYCWSPALIPKPNDWGREISIAGFYFLNLASSYVPDPELAAFLEAGPPPVYIGFGSIVVDDPDHLTRMIFDAISMTGVRALVSKGWGGLGADSLGIPDGVYMLGNVPHDWLFQKVSCVVHHGGAGTTAAGIQTGKPTVVVPFFGDQPFWGAMIARAGAGPTPIPYKKLTGESLAAAIQDCLRPETQEKAKELGEKIREEKGADVGAKSFHDFIDTSKLRCSLAPSRVAVWRVRRSQIRLSAFAATVLVKDGVVSYQDLKLYRSHEYNTDDQPWDPISAVTSALLGDISSIAMAVTDFPREIFKAKTKKESSTPGTPTTEEPLSKAPSATGTAGSTRPATPQQGASETASLSSVQPTPSVTVSAPEPELSAQSSNTRAESITPATSLDTSLSATRTPRGRAGSQGSPQQREPSASPGNFNLEAAIGAGKGVSRIVGTGMKTPMNFCLGLARGFRNAPRLYNDDTVRPQEKVTDFTSGLRIAGKEFGLGLYDGISGLVTQPLRGAEKEGGVGLLKGFGKGIGGLVLKVPAAAWSLPAYAMQGVHAEIHGFFHRSVQNYIITSRILEGEEDYKNATSPEKEDIHLRWTTKTEDLKGYYSLKEKEKRQDTSRSRSRSVTEEGGPDEGNVGDEAPKTGWFHTRNLSWDERKKRQAQKDAWKQRQAGNAAAGRSTISVDSAAEEEEFEQAIRESVAQTSRGNKEEDAMVEAQIRASVREMRRIASQSREVQDVKRPVPPPPLPPRAEDHDITDEEYQSLIEEAVRQSLAHQGAEAQGRYAPDDDDDDDDEELRRAIEASRLSGHDGDEDENLRRAIEASRASGRGDAHDEDLRRAIEESERAHKEELARDTSAKTEEEIVLEYVRKQSLAEEEHRRRKAKGKAAAQGDDDNDDDDDDEDMKRALEESLKASGGDGNAGSSSSA